MFLYSSFVPPLSPPTLLLFFISIFVSTHFFHNETAFVPACVCASSHSLSLSIVLLSVWQCIHQEVFSCITDFLHLSPAPEFVISFSSCRETIASLSKCDVFGNWGHLNWQQCSNYLKFGSVLHETAHVESINCHKQHLICTAFISGWGLALSSRSWQLEGEQVRPKETQQTSIKILEEMYSLQGDKYYIWV